MKRSIQGRASRIRDHIEHQSEDLIESVQRLASLALEDTGDAWKRARKRGAGLFEDGRDQLRRGVDRSEELVSNAPLRSVLVAACVGLLIGLACRR